VSKSQLKTLVITDTIEASPAVQAVKNIRVVPTAPVFAQSVLNTWNGTSISSLLDVATLGPIYEGMYSRA